MGKRKVNGLPRQSNQNRMIPCPLSPPKGLLEAKYAAYCTTVSPLSQKKGERHTIFAPTPIGTPVQRRPKTHAFPGPELSDAECRRESRQALTSSTAPRSEKRRA